MTEQPEGAAPQVSGSQPVSPTPQIGPEGSGAAGSEGGRSVEAIVEQAVARVTEQLKPYVDQAVQGRFDSGKDKRFSQVQKIADYIEQAKGDVPQAIRNMVIDDMVEGREITTGQAATVRRSEQGPEGTGFSPAAAMPGPDPAKAAADLTTQVLTEEGVPLEHPLIQELLQKRFQTVNQYELELRRAVARVKKGNNVSPGATVVEGGRGPVPTPDVQKEYDRRFAALKGSRDPRALLELRKWGRANGLNV
jgi:hypothetical protein